MTLFERSNVIAMLLLMLVICFSAGAENYPDEPLNQPTLSTMPIASGSFVQRKYFKVLKHPIKSQGELYFDVSIGLLWQTEQPIYSALLLKKSGLFTENGTGDSQELKGASAISQVLLNIMSGDSEQLAKNFTINASTIDHCLSLTPKLTQLAKIIDNVQLCHINTPEKNQQNLNDINHIVLHEHSGNRTEITLQLTPMTMLPEAVRARLQ
ncbi:outer membrane lipoprotein carrier protein LolA [Cognaticolwellia aestuarii]|uniref:outer membrane lipoprotein carrier protein LolA n=1 Tax=Cognaticolwellia aestuarii TaxID=329993 RepID=UPI000984A584|nr:outer membrane lipoprotein carrier protein LolA [Cognaticolwellia aestuarii]